MGMAISGGRSRSLEVTSWKSLPAVPPEGSSSRGTREVTPGATRWRLEWEPLPLDTLRLTETFWIFPDRESDEGPSSRGLFSGMREEAAQHQASTCE